MGDEPDGGGGYCNSLYYEGCDDEVEGLEAVEALVSDGVIGDDTLVYCDEDSFPYEEWTKWGECAYLFGLGEPPQLCYSVRLCGTLCNPHAVPCVTLTPRRYPV
eukprot:COSAG01_NODE_4454_length_5006_cov_27.029550_3_plen_104_part_00